ncbi:MAG: hypothetical protein BJ554DRAFT_1142, partial [Olpidium bornovanus]
RFPQVKRRTIFVSPVTPSAGPKADGAGSDAAEPNGDPCEGGSGGFRQFDWARLANKVPHYRGQPDYLPSSPTLVGRRGAYLADADSDTCEDICLEPTTPIESQPQQSSPGGLLTKEETRQFARDCLGGEGL